MGFLLVKFMKKKLIFLFLIIILFSNCSSYKEIKILNDNEVPKWFLEIEKTNQSKASSISTSIELSRTKAVNIAVNKLMVKKFGKSEYDIKIKIIENQIVTEQTELTSKNTLEKKQIISYKILKEEIILNKDNTYQTFILIEEK